MASQPPTRPPDGPAPDLPGGPDHGGAGGGADGPGTAPRDPRDVPVHPDPKPV